MGAGECRGTRRGAIGPVWLLTEDHAGSAPSKGFREAFPDLNFWGVADLF